MESYLALSLILMGIYKLSISNIPTPREVIPIPIPTEIWFSFPFPWESHSHDMHISSYNITQ